MFRHWFEKFEASYTQEETGHYTVFVQHHLMVGGKVGDQYFLDLSGIFTAKNELLASNDSSFEILDVAFQPRQSQLVLKVSRSDIKATITLFACKGKREKSAKVTGIGGKSNTEAEELSRSLMEDLGRRLQSLHARLRARGSSIICESQKSQESKTAHADALICVDDPEANKTLCHLTYTSVQLDLDMVKARLDELKQVVETEVKMEKNPKLGVPAKMCSFRVPQYNLLFHIKKGTVQLMLGTLSARDCMRFFLYMLASGTFHPDFPERLKTRTAEKKRKTAVKKSKKLEAGEEAEPKKRKRAAPNKKAAEDTVVKKPRAKKAAPVPAPALAPASPVGSSCVDSVEDPDEDSLEDLLRKFFTPEDNIVSLPPCDNSWMMSDSEIRTGY